MFQLLKNNYTEDVITLSDVELVYANKESNLLPNCFLNYYNYCLIKQNNQWNIACFAERFQKMIETFNNHEDIILKKISQETKNSYFYDEAFLISFFCANVGHSINTVLKCIQTYKSCNLSTTILVYDDILLYGNFFKSILFLFFEPHKVIFIKSLSQIHCKKLTIVENKCDARTDELDFFLLNCLRLQKYKLKLSRDCSKICLIKCDNTKNTFQERKFDSSWINFFQINNFTLIQAENFDVKALYYLLNSASQIVLSWGCNSYLNSVFIENPLSHTLVLCHKGYENEYIPLLQGSGVAENSIERKHYFPKKGTVNYLLNLSNSITDENKTDIKSLLNF